MTDSHLFGQLSDNSYQPPNFEQIRIITPDGSSHLVWRLIDLNFPSKTQKEEFYPSNHQNFVKK